MDKVIIVYNGAEILVDESIADYLWIRRIKLDSSVAEIGHLTVQWLDTPYRQPDHNSHSRDSEIGQQQPFQAGADTPSAGQHNTQTPVAVDRDWSGVAGSVIGTDTASKTAVVLEAVGLIENLLDVNDQPKEKETKRQVVERKNRQKKKQSHEHEWGEISL